MGGLLLSFLTEAPSRPGFEMGTEVTDSNFR